MKKYLSFILALVLLASITAACTQEAGTTETNQPVASNEPVIQTTEVSGRIIETVSGDYTIIRNEEDTSVYYEIDISGGVTSVNGVEINLDPNNVISADVVIVDDEAFPIKTTLVEITANTSPSYSVINAEEAKAKIDAGNVIILDVRTREEYEAGYIPNSFNLPLGTIAQGIGNITTDKSATLLVYCRSGNRSKVAARELTELGYENVYDFGGIVNWPYDIVEP